MISLLIYGITILAVLATAIFSIWTYVDTSRKFSQQEFIQSRAEKLTTSIEHFKDKK